MLPSSWRSTSEIAILWFWGARCLLRKLAEVRLNQAHDDQDVRSELKQGEPHHDEAEDAGVWESLFAVELSPIPILPRSCGSVASTKQGSCHCLKQTGGCQYDVGLGWLDERMEHPGWRRTMMVMS